MRTIIGMELRPAISPAGVPGESALIPRDSAGKREVAEWCGGTVTAAGGIQFYQGEISIRAAPGQRIMKTEDGDLLTLDE